MSKPRVRRCDDPKHPDAVLIEKWGPLKLRHGTGVTPRGWVAIAWFPSSSAMRDRMEESRKSHRKALRSHDDALAKLEELETGALVVPLPVSLVET